MLLLFLVLAACTGEATIEGDDSTPSPPADTDHDTAADTAPGTTPTDTGTVYEPLCGGEGPGSAQLGHGGTLDNFTPITKGDRVPIATEPGAGTYGLTFDLVTQGLDTRGDIHAIMRVHVGDQISLFNGFLRLQCPQPGPGWVSFHANFEPSLQDTIDNGDWDGAQALVELVLIDQTNDRAELDLPIVLTGP